MFHLPALEIEDVFRTLGHLWMICSRVVHTLKSISTLIPEDEKAAEFQRLRDAGLGCTIAITPHEMHLGASRGV